MTYAQILRAALRYPALAYAVATQAALLAVLAWATVTSGGGVAQPGPRVACGVAAALYLVRFLPHVVRAERRAWVAVKAELDA